MNTDVRQQLDHAIESLRGLYMLGEACANRQEVLERAIKRLQSVDAALAAEAEPLRGDALYESFGYALATEVLQSGFYARLGERAKAECDALVNGTALSASAEAPGREPDKRRCHSPGDRCEGCPHYYGKADTCIYAPKSPSGAGPVAMLLYCPRCQKQHIDAPETDEQYAARLHESAWWEGGGHKPPRWTNPPHATHTCKGCGLNWRPSNAPTVGVAAIPVAELGSEAKHIERMEATNPALYVAPSSSAAEMRERAARVCEEEATKLGGQTGLALDAVAARIRLLKEKE